MAYDKARSCGWLSAGCDPWLSANTCFFQVGASFHLTNVSIHIVDLKKVQPFGGPTPASPASPFTHGNSLRKSFSKEKPLGLRPRATLDVNTIEESASGTDPEEDCTVEKKDYSEVFKPIRARE